VRPRHVRAGAGPRPRGPASACKFASAGKRGRVRTSERKGRPDGHFHPKTSFMTSLVPSKVRIRKIVPEVPRDEVERGELLEDLQTMGCFGLLEKPWGFKDKEVVRELLDGVSNEFDNSIWVAPTRWTEEVWREVYNFSTGGGGLAGRKDEYVRDCFKELPNPKDGYSIEDCMDPRHRRMLAFLAPIIYPGKPNRITVTLGNTIFGALIGGRKVNWAKIITNHVIQLASRVGKSRASPICPFLYHLYERKELLKPEEEKTWKV
jgi:hypothetical protein